MYAITPRHHRSMAASPSAATWRPAGRRTSTGRGSPGSTPARLDGWSPDFRLVLGDGEACAEVKPVSKFPMDVAQRILNAGWKSEVVILGLGPRHA